MFWGAQTSVLISQVAIIPNPLHIRESKVWREDLRYHLHNHHWLLSMVFCDPLDPYGGPFGHRVAFWHLAMLLFCLVVVTRVSIGSTSSTTLLITLGLAGKCLA